MRDTLLQSTSPLSMHLLGAPYFECGGHPVDLTATKPAAVLTYLTVTGASHPREHILDLLWTESPVESGRKNLRNALWAIRKALGDQVLHTSGEYLSLSDNVWNDVQSLDQAAAKRSSATLEELKAAIELYRGPLADGLVLDYAPDFELWLTAERERLANLYLQVLETLLEAGKAAGDWTGIIALARQGLKHHPWEETLYQALIEAHAQRGERSEALRQYEALKLVLNRELGVEPLPETQALQEAVKLGMNKVAPLAGLGSDLGISTGRLTTAEPQPWVSGSLNPGVAKRASEDVPFIDRLAERRWLDAELEALSGGRARVVLLTGELGIGKSRLWAEWSGHLGQLGSSVSLLQTRCLATTQTIPLAPLADLFSQAIEGREFRPSAQPFDLLATFEGYVQYLLDFEMRPLVMFIDDLHCADDTTLEWLAYMVNRLREHPLLLVGAYQAEGVSAPLARLVADWLREGVVRRLPLGRLSDYDSKALLAGCGCHPKMVKQALSVGMGNPYFLIELSKELQGLEPAKSASVVPTALAELIRTRLDRLPRTARGAAMAAAVLPTSFEFSDLLQVSGRGEVEAVDAIEILLRAGVLCERDGYYAFAHPLVRAVVSDGMSQARRDLLCRRLTRPSDGAQSPRHDQKIANGPMVALSHAPISGSFAQG